MAKVPSYIERFIETVYPGYGALALASFNEETALRDATAEIERLRKCLQWISHVSTDEATRTAASNALRAAPESRDG